jgi:hypothetical protein
VVLGLPIPGYLVWVAVIYAILGTWLTHKVGKPLAMLDFLQQKLEANFRFSLARLRENVEEYRLRLADVIDAYRAGLIYGLMNELDWDTTGRIASLMGSIKIAHSGTQNHRFDMNEFQQRFRAAFGREL